ncbi:CoA pyrophosphatase [Neisseria animalis]|uniref:CoA pyrophosphatase n=2 Tax=Neisseria animalis TaxID=492 RepID=A0A5P3MTZ8_NEIAN|nr:CoA pyrophosphatase [Neisseria animalis]ROW31473.1 CoA pyrophosphatase [Neisseria animalis]
MTQPQLAAFLNCAATYPASLEALRNRLLDSNPERARKAAVLLPCLHDGNQWQLLLTRRSEQLRHHTGQISLPGGGREKHDKDFTQTALRETEEETGIPSAAWQTFPQLPPHYTPSGYEVHPVPAIYTAAQPPLLLPDSNEVAEIFYIPLSVVLNPENYAERILHFNGSNLASPTLPYLHYDIWGLTAIILYGLAERYQHHRQYAV